jgi:mannose-6-phosphate isomerase-like protein (cupin superfamily)
MFKSTRRLISALALCAAGFAAALLIGYRSDAADTQGRLLKSKVVDWETAEVRQSDWGQMRTYFRGETYCTKDVLTAVAVIEPGKAIHRAHRHSQEEYLIVVAGSGTWHLAGREFPAKRGDILYIEPWVYHGTTNTGDEPLILVVVRYNPKAVDIPPRPDNQPDEL